MKVVVGSKNEPKRRAVIDAFAKAYPSEEITVETVAAESGVSSHPTSGTESLKGAENRAKHARELMPDADFYVGIEGGLLVLDKRAWELSWIAIQDKDGQVFTALSAGIEMRGKVLAAIQRGQELSEVLEDYFGIKAAGKAGGFYGLATDNQVTRQQACEQAIIFALGMSKHPEYFE